MTAVIFIATVLIWGTTWIAIAMQVGPVPAVVSVFYRFALAGAVFLALLALTGRLRLPLRRHLAGIAALSLCLFSLNFICIYNSARFIPSGLISVIFSLATIYNAINARLFFGDRIAGRTVVAGAMGVAGLTLIFGRDIAAGLGAETLKGVGLAALGTYFFSLGNMMSRRNTAAGLATVDANAWGMAGGAAVLMVIILLTGTPVVAPPDARYLWALAYLSVIGSVVGFTTYLMLVTRLGSARAAYATVLFPIVALTVSTLFEGYVWHWQAVAGLALALAGNVVIFTGGAAGRRAAALPRG